MPIAFAVARGDRLRSEPNRKLAKTSKLPLYFKRARATAFFLLA